MSNKKILSDKTVGLKPSGIRKFFDLVSEMKDAISLGVGEPDFDTPWHIRDEGIYSLEKGRTFYTSNSGLKELRQEICRYMKRTQDIDYVWDEEVFITVGGSEAIDLMFRAMINEGDEVLIPQPSYVSYEPCAILADAVPVINYAFKISNDAIWYNRKIERCIYTEIWGEEEKAPVECFVELLSTVEPVKDTDWELVEYRRCTLGTFTLERGCFDQLTNRSRRRLDRILEEYGVYI